MTSQRTTTGSHGPSSSSISSLLPWHPIHASSSEDMWEIPSSSSSSSSSSGDSNTTTTIIHDDGESFYVHHHRYHNDVDDDRNERESMILVMNNHNHNAGVVEENDIQGEPSTSRLFTNTRKKCVLGDATNLRQRKSNTSTIPTNIDDNRLNRRRIRTSYFN